MGHTKLNIFRNVFALALLLILGACGGADIPYLNTVPNSSQGTGLPPTAGSPNGNSNLEGCAISFNSSLVLQAKGNGDLSEVKSDPRPLKPIPLRFGGSQVAIYAQEFPTIDLVIEAAPAAMRIQQKEGSVAQGSYDAASGKVEIRNVVFILTLLDKTSLEPMGIAPIEMPPMTLSSEAIEQSGSFGALQAQGQALTAEKHELSLVGGLALPNSFPSDDLQGAALVVSFSGALSDAPASGNCSASFSNGVEFKKIEVQSSGEVEREINDNILALGRVYVPQSGVDVVVQPDARFISQQKVRVKNNSDAAIQANLQSSENFKFLPQGSVTIAAGAFQDIQIEFSAKPQADYSEAAVPASRDMSMSLSFGPSTLELRGELRRAAPELVIKGSEENAASTVDLGLIPAEVLGTGPNARLHCSAAPGKKIPLVSRKISIENHGIRPLQISKIHNAVDVQPQTKDPFCGGFPAEFNRVALSQEGKAQCATQLLNGKTYLLDQCSLPDSQGSVSFKVVYFPVNASSIRNAEGGKPIPDAGSLSIASNDPRYDASKGRENFKLNLLAGVSPDQSDVLRLSKDGSQVQVTNGGNIRVNIPNSAEESVTQKLVMMNYLDQPLNDIQISAESSQFEIQGAPIQIPAMAAGGSEPGKAEFSVKFMKTAGMSEGDIPTRLRVKFTPQSGTQNIFEINLIGSVNHQVLTGTVFMKIDFISSFFDSNLLRSAPIDSHDFRSGRFDAFKPGDMELVFTEVEGQEHLRKVTIRHKLNINPENPNLMDAILNLTPQDRKNFLRVYSTRLSGYPGGAEDGNNDGVPDCIEPQSLRSPFEAAHCSFFYYVFSTKPGQEGIYNDETGELSFPDVSLRLLNPYHATVLDYDSNLLTNTELKASISTLSFDALNAGDLPLVPEPRLSSGDIAVPDDIMNNLQAAHDQQCPPDWLPWDASKKPVFSCFVRPASPHYLRGFPARPLGKEQSLVLSMMTKLNAAGTAENVPSFMANARIWVAILGRLTPANP